VSDHDPTRAAGAAQPTRRHRRDATAQRAAFEAAWANHGTSQRQFAAEHHLPRTTLQHWLHRKAALQADPVVASFLESPRASPSSTASSPPPTWPSPSKAPAASAFISLFLRLTGLDRVAASSYGAQQQQATAVEAGIIAFGQGERTRLAAGMAPREISLCEDETFHPQTCLVALEPVSNFLLLEQYAQRRDAATWTAATSKALEGLPVSVRQALGDEAKGLLAHARDGLGVPHGPDLFHVQQELCKATAAVLAAHVRRARQAVADAQARIDEWRARQEEAARQPRPPGRPLDYAMRLEVAEHGRACATARLAAAEQRQELMREAIRGLGAD
jgi:hypothetical protein